MPNGVKTVQAKLNRNIRNRELKKEKKAVNQPQQSTSLPEAWWVAKLKQFIKK